MAGGSRHRHRPPPLSTFPQKSCVPTWVGTSYSAWIFSRTPARFIGQFITDFYVHGTDLPSLKIGIRLAMLAVVGIAYKKDDELLHGLMLVGLLTMLTFNLFGFYFIMN